MPWQVEFHAGVWLPQIEWWLDARFPQRRSFVSHAHSDHVAAHGEILCSAGTSKLMQARMPGRRIEHVLSFGAGEQLTADTTVTLHPAGHIFGSAQSLLVHERHGSLLYTGDFKLRRGRSAEACETPRADVLIMETTFGRPHYVFPPTDQVLRDIAAFCHACLDEGETPVLFGYSLGKSQELLCGLAEARVPVMLHPQTLRLTRVYQESGISFPPHRAFAPAEIAGHVVICPPQAPGSAFLKQIPKCRTAVITGWAVDPGAIYRYQCDAAFPLSDHADYPDLLRFVEAVQPKQVYTLHGFAAEFAATLRERGIEAWAIGEDNQLDLSLPRPVCATPLTDPCPVPTCPPDRPEGFARFALVAEQVKATPRKLEKIERLRAYLAELSPEQAAHAALFFTARAFPRSDDRVLGLGWSVIKQALLAVAGLTEADYRAADQRFADAGDAAEALLDSRREGRMAAPVTAGPATLADIAGFFTAIAVARGPARKLELLQQRLADLTPVEAKYLVKIVTGDLRVGLKEGLVEEAIAAAANQTVEAVQTANMLAGDMAAVTRAAYFGTLATIELRVFHPVQFMLASPEPTAESVLQRLAPPLWLEEKYDGIRCQIHKQASRVELYSRDLTRITGRFPELVQAAAALPGDFIGDGELLAWRDGRALPFAELQKRLDRQGGDDFFLGAEIPVSLSLYDLLWRNGRGLLGEPLAARRRLLDELLAAVPPTAGSMFPVTPVRDATTALEIEAAFLAARQRGHEGLMIKDPQSRYTPGRRGLAWLKFQKAARI